MQKKWIDEREVYLAVFSATTTTPHIYYYFSANENYESYPLFTVY